MRLMGAIIYKPHCSKCGAVINQEITYKIVGEIGKTHLFGRYLVGINPIKCARCGEVFETIEIPMPKEEIQYED